MRLRRRKPDYAHIAELERESAALDAVIPSLDQQIQEAHDTALAARRDKDWSPGRGVVLDKNSTPVAALSPGFFEMRPGAVYPVTVCASAVSYVPRVVHAHHS